MSLPENVSEKVERTDFSYLKDMKGVRQALVAQVTGADGAVDIGRLVQASPEDQRILVENALEVARVDYVQRKSHDKLRQLGEVREALGEGRLTLTGFLEGLGLKAPVVENSWGKGVFGRIKESLHRSART